MSDTPTLNDLLKHYFKDWDYYGPTNYSPIHVYTRSNEDAEMTYAVHIDKTWIKLGSVRFSGYAPITDIRIQAADPELITKIEKWLKE